MQRQLALVEDNGKCSSTVEIHRIQHETLWLIRDEIVAEMRV